MFEDENGNRPGDWMHKAERARRKTDGLVTDPNEKKWYQQTFWIIVFLFLFWPAGIILAWRSDWPRAGKIAATVLVVAWVGYALYTLGTAPA